MEKVWLIVLGAFLGAVPTLFMGWLNNRAAAKRQQNQLALELALGEYRAILENARANQVIYPPSTYIPVAHMTVKAFTDGELSTDDLNKYYSRLVELAEKNKAATKKYFQPKV